MSWETSSAFCAGFGRFFLFPSSESLCHGLEVSSLRVSKLLMGTGEDTWGCGVSLLFLFSSSCASSGAVSLRWRSNWKEAACWTVVLSFIYLFILPFQECDGCIHLCRLWSIFPSVFCPFAFYILTFSLLTEAGLLESKIMFKFYEI